MEKTIDSIIANYDRGYTATQYGTVDEAKRFRRYDYDDLIRLLKEDRELAGTARNESSLPIADVSGCSSCGCRSVTYLHGEEVCAHCNMIL